MPVGVAAAGVVAAGVGVSDQRGLGAGAEPGAASVPAHCIPSEPAGQLGGALTEISVIVPRPVSGTHPYTVTECPELARRTPLKLKPSPRTTAMAGSAQSRLVIFTSSITTLTISSHVR